VAQQINQRVKYMSALPTPRSESTRKLSKKQAARAIARLLEEHMEELGLSEAEKNARAAALTERVDRAIARASRAGNPAKRP
jgi:hypothetical protein